MYKYYWQYIVPFKKIQKSSYTWDKGGNCGLLVLLMLGMVPCNILLGNGWEEFNPWLKPRIGTLGLREWRIYKDKMTIELVSQPWHRIRKRNSWIGALRLALTSLDSILSISMFSSGLTVASFIERNCTAKQIQQTHYIKYLIIQMLNMIYFNSPLPQPQDCTNSISSQVISYKEQICITSIIVWIQCKKYHQWSMTISRFDH